MARQQSTINDKIKRLRELSDKAGPSMYERVRLVSEILLDRAYVDAHFGGDEGKAEDKYAEDYFPDIAGVVEVSILRDIYRMFPDEAVWKENHYNLRTMKILRDTQRKQEKQPGEPKPRTTVKDIKDRDDRIEELAFEVKREQQASKRSEERIRELEKENANLKEENATLRGRITELERVLDRMSKRELATA